MVLRYIIPVDHPYWGLLIMPKKSKTDEPELTEQDAQDIFVLVQYKSRKQWEALPPVKQDPLLERPVSYIALSYILPNGIDSLEAVRQLQRRDMQDGFSDMLCNFLIDQDGHVFEGRGFYTQPGKPAEYPGFEHKYYEFTYLGDYKAQKCTYATGQLIDVLKNHKFVSDDVQILRPDQRKDFKQS